MKIPSKSSFSASTWSLPRGVGFVDFSFPLDDAGDFGVDFDVGFGLKSSDICLELPVILLDLVAFEVLLLFWPNPVAGDGAL